MQMSLSSRLSLSTLIALDPALPLFGDVSDENRIDPSDAEYVDVIHTAGGESSRIKASTINGTKLESPRALAFIEPRGHADFYVNGGRNQPGCGMDFFGILILWSAEGWWNEYDKNSFV